jgi:hypothetical protein
VIPHIVLHTSISLLCSALFRFPSFHRDQLPFPTHSL